LIEVDTNLDEVIIQLREDIGRVQRLSRQYVPTFAQRAVELAQEEAPKRRTGTLASSIRTLGNSYEMVVKPTVHYATYVITGTSPSPGRYVPAIGKRLVSGKRKIGIHPGMKPNPFMNRALERLLQESQSILERLVSIFR